MFELTKSDVISSLKNINDAKFNFNLLTLNSIKNFELDNDRLNLEISINGSDTEEAKSLVENQLKKDFSNLKTINITVVSKSSSISTHKDPKKDAINAWSEKHHSCSKR